MPLSCPKSRSRTFGHLVRTGVVLGLLLFTVSCVQVSRTRPNESILTGYTGPSISGVDTSTLDGKVMTGYQGWFNAQDDGADLGWTHWARDKTKTFGPKNLTVDLWPEMSEYSENERFETDFTYADGSTAEVFSSYTAKPSSATSNGCVNMVSMAHSCNASPTVQDDGTGGITKTSCWRTPAKARISTAAPTS